MLFARLPHESAQQLGRNAWRSRIDRHQAARSRQWPRLARELQRRERRTSARFDDATAHLDALALREAFPQP
jgi:hypothetical protein